MANSPVKAEAENIAAWHIFTIQCPSPCDSSTIPEFSWKELEKALKVLVN
jgi:hypothetical protein